MNSKIFSEVEDLSNFIFCVDSNLLSLDLESSIRRTFPKSPFISINFCKIQSLMLGARSYLNRVRFSQEAFKAINPIEDKKKDQKKKGKDEEKKIEYDPDALLISDISILISTSSELSAQSANDKLKFSGIKKVIVPGRLR